MYKSIKIICIIHSEQARDFITTCMHHFYFVVSCSMGIWVLIKQIVDRHEGISILLTVGSCMVIGVIVFLEWFIVSFLSKAAAGSKEFLHRMLKYGEKNKYERKVLAGLLPNCINLEMIGSVETMRHGIERNYFLNFVSRVTDCTVRSLLAKRKIDIII